ncbi:TetR/AcrR family transcriptional regulator [Microbacterium lacticum]
MSIPRTARLPAAERRESILAAAETVFGERGYTGATTDVIATVAGISQAYVIRTFGSKEALFVATAQRALDRVAEAFRDAIADADTEPRGRVEPLLGAAYAQLVQDRGTLLILLHLFTLGHDPVIGPVAREGFLSTYRILRDEAGLSSERATAFLANGMMVNIILGLRLPGLAADDGAARELLTATFRENTELVLKLFGADAGPLS